MARINVVGRLRGFTARPGLRGFTGLLCVGVLVPALLVGQPSFAGPAESPSPPQGGDDELGRTRPKDESVAEIRQRLEAGIVELGLMANAAKEQNDDAAKSACLVDKQERGNAAMELATGELLVIQDANANAEQKEFAREKLQAAADRVGALIDEAIKCSGETALAEEGQITNTVDAPKLIPVEDPTAGEGTPPVPPPVDINLPETYASPSR